MTTRYYVARQGQSDGPFDIAQLKQLVDSGQLLPTDLVCREGEQAWAAASTVPSLFPISPPVAVAVSTPSTSHATVETENARQLRKSPIFLAVLVTAGVSLIMNFVLCVLFLFFRGGSQLPTNSSTPTFTPEEIRRHQEVAIKEIDRLKGTYECEDGDRQKPIVAVNLAGKPCTDTHLGDLAKLPKLQKLILYGTNVTDAGLAHVKSLKELQKLNLTSTDITDAGLAHIKDMKSLQELDITNTDVTDVGLAHLKSLTNLRTLVLYQCRKISNTGLMHLVELKNLQTLDLRVRGPSVTDAGIDELQKALPGVKIRR